MNEKVTWQEDVRQVTFFIDIFLNLFTISTCNYQLGLLYLRCIKSGKQ